MEKVTCAQVLYVDSRWRNDEVYLISLSNLF